MKKPTAKRRIHWAAYLWPGLPHLWISGSIAGLALALGFTVLLNLLILSTLVWPEWLAPRVQLGCAVSAALVWVAALIETRAELGRLAVQKENEAQAQQREGEPLAPLIADRRPDALFCLAQRQYLRAEWNEAERTLRSLLSLDQDDPEAQLLLAGVHRRTGRASDALRRLRRLLTREGGEQWSFEVKREMDRLQMTAETAQHEETPRQAA